MVILPINVMKLYAQLVRSQRVLEGGLASLIDIHTQYDIIELRGGKYASSSISRAIRNVIKQRLFVSWIVPAPLSSSPTPIISQSGRDHL
jgi:hypothetical protein